MTLDIDRERPTMREVADLVALITMEAVELLAPEHADVALEALAGQLLTNAGALNHNPRIQAMLQAVAETMIATEAGSSTEWLEDEDPG